MLQPLLSIDVKAVEGLEDIFNDVRMNKEQQDHQSRYGFGLQLRGSEGLIRVDDSPRPEADECHGNGEGHYHEQFDVEDAEELHLVELVRSQVVCREAVN